MKRPWMPIYWTDFIADTQHLSAEEIGAYLLLIGHYWLRGGLPEDDERLARIAKVSVETWRAIRPTIQAFFHDGWKHARVDFELCEAERISNARREAKTRQKTTTSGQSGNGGSNDTPTIVQRSANDHTNDPATNPQPPQPPPQDNKTRGAHPSIEDTEHWQIANRIADLCGPYEQQQFTLGNWGGAPAVVQLWRTQWSKELILSSVQRQLSTRKARRINTIRFFEHGIGEDAARLCSMRETSTPATVCSNGQATQHYPADWKGHRDGVRAAVAEFRNQAREIAAEGGDSGGGQIVELSGHS